METRYSLDYYNIWIITRYNLDEHNTWKINITIEYVIDNDELRPSPIITNIMYHDTYLRPNASLMEYQMS